MTTAITRTDVSKAAGELASMRRGLTAWLDRRAFNDQRSITVPNRFSIEQDLSSKLHALLSEVMPEASLPNADLRSNPSAAVQLASIAITGQVPVMQGNPAAMGATPPWMWPVMIVGGLLLAITTAIRSAADVAKDAEEKACIRAGACTDYGFWLKAGGVAALVWFAWRELGLEHTIKGLVRKGGR